MRRTVAGRTTGRWRGVPVLQASPALLSCPNPDPDPPQLPCVSCSNCEAASLSSRAPTQPASAPSALLPASCHPRLSLESPSPGVHTPVTRTHMSLPGHLLFLQGRPQATVSGAHGLTCFRADPLQPSPLAPRVQGCSTQLKSAPPALPLLLLPPLHALCTRSNPPSAIAPSLLLRRVLERCSSRLASPPLHPHLGPWGRQGCFLGARSFHSLGSPLVYSPIVELKLAQTGEGIAECELLQWFVQEGEEVQQFQLVCQVQSDKATVDITSRYHGRIVRTHFVPGDIVKVGETLVDILQMPDGDDMAAVEQQLMHMRNGSAGADPKDQTLATPAVRGLAKTYGVSLGDVAGTGKGGRVTKEDVVRHVAMRQSVEEEVRTEQHALEGQEEEGGRVVEVGLDDAMVQRPSSVPLHVSPAQGTVEEKAVEQTVGELPELPVVRPLAAPESHPRDTEIAIRGYRRAMVKSMAAATSIPHFNFMDEFDVSALSDLLSRLNSAEPGSHGSSGPGSAKLSHLSFLVKALSLALLRHPSLNATVDAQVSVIKCSGAHNIGIAMATQQGLVVPNVKHCERLSVSEIAVEINRLRQLAAENQLSPADLANGTITISNIGAVGGGTYACPLVFQPQLAIVAIGRVRKLPRFDSSGGIRAAAVMHVSWAADHRVVDGAALANLSLDWQQLVEHPERMLLSLR